MGESETQTQTIVFSISGCTAVSRAISHGMNYVAMNLIGKHQRLNE